MHKSPEPELSGAGGVHVLVDHGENWVLFAP